MPPVASLVGTPRPGHAPLLPNRIDAAGESHAGLERDRNEDQFMVAALRRALCVGETSVAAANGWSFGSCEGLLLAVADGIGGLEDGEVASSLAVHGLAGDLWNEVPWLVACGHAPTVRQHVRVLSALQAAFRAAHEAIAGACLNGPMGSTLTAALVLWPHLYLAHAGDCRGYLLRSGEILRLTRDHTIGQLARERGGPAVDPESSEDALWNALGGPGWGLHVDLCRHQLQRHDTLLLCSDGVTKHLDDARLCQLLASGESSRAICRRLVDAALDGGGWDNITAVVARAP